MTEAADTRVTIITGGSELPVSRPISHKRHALYVNGETSQLPE